MSMSSIRHGSGPGSAMPLSAETIKVRDKVIERFIDKSLDELTSFLENALQVEKDEERRLGMLAARIYILRHRIEHVKEYNRDPSVEPMEVPTPRSMLAEPEPDETPQAEEPDVADDTATSIMKEVKTIETGEINGVRIPAGITIMVNKEDAERMIANGKAVYVVKDEDGNTVQLDETAAMPETEQSTTEASVLEMSEQDKQLNEYVSGDPASGTEAIAAEDDNATSQEASPETAEADAASEDAAEAEAATDIATDTAIEAEADTDNGAVSEESTEAENQQSQKAGD